MSLLASEKVLKERCEALEKHVSDQSENWDEARLHADSLAS